MFRHFAEDDEAARRPQAGLPQVLAQDEDVFKTGIQRRFIKWEPLCNHDNWEFRHPANLLTEVFSHVSFNDDLVNKLLNRPRAKTAEILIWPHLSQRCEPLKRGIEEHLERGLPDCPAALVKALVFYRRHSHRLQYHLNYALVAAFERMCNAIFVFLIRAGYSGRNFSIP